MANKTKLIELLPGSEILISPYGGGSSFYSGYTRGISIRINYNNYEMKNQKYGGGVGAKLIEASGEIKVGLLEYSVYNVNLLFTRTIGSEPNYWVLDIYGRTFGGNIKNFRFLKVYADTVDEFKLGKEETVFEITFKAVLNEDGRLFEFTNGD